MEPGVLVGFLLTLFIYSYLVRDNPLYRLAIHILVGVSAAYAAVVAIRQVIFPILNQMRQEPISASTLLWIIPVILGILLLFRRLPSASRLGAGALAILVGVGATVALIGATVGTLWPQVAAFGGDEQGPIQGLIVAFLTVCTLFTFQFTSSRVTKEGVWLRPVWQRGLASVGQAVLAITFGALFASVFITSLALLTDRFSLYLGQFSRLLP